MAVILAVIFLYVLYGVVRAAVRSGVEQAEGYFSGQQGTFSQLSGQARPGD
ncbi:hypothetical protein ACW0JT_25105 [Arthrobacter sp. SA17]